MPNHRPKFTGLKSLSALGLVILAGPFAGSVTAQTPVRGRDPWAFRLILENKTRMLVLALRSDLWVAYNPANGSLHKVWSGGIQYRGKVYDFGQWNSATTGVTYHQLEKAFILAASDESSIPAGWSATGVTSSASTWTLASGSGTQMVSPAVNLTAHDRVILSYQTPNASNRLLVDVSTDNGVTWTAQQWTSLEGAMQDGNQKLLAVTGSQVRFRFRRNTTGSTATLADIELTGDYRAWKFEQGGVPVVPVVDWRGYRLIGHTEGIVLSYDLVLPNGSRIAVKETPEAMTGTALSRRFEVSGIPSGGRVSLELDGTGYQANHTVVGGGSLRTQGGDTFLDFTADAQKTLNTTWTP